MSETTSRDDGTGRQWRGMGEWEGSAEFEEALAAEFPSLAATTIDRRGLLKIMGASLAMATLAGCQADENAMPYVQAPDFVTLGKPKFYASAVVMAGYAQPIIGRTYVGRPTKLEGNPQHSASGGATDSFTQTALLGLYDPARSRAPRHLGRPAAMDAFETAMVENAARLDARGGAGLRLLTGAVTSPTLARQIQALQTRWPAMRWHVLEPFDDANALEATTQVFGRPLALQPARDRAAVTVSFDDDWLGPGPRQTLNARMWAQRRAMLREGTGECRLFVAEPVPTNTGVTATDRLPAAPPRIGVLLSEVARGVGIDLPAQALTDREAAWTRGAAETLKAHRGASLVTVGAACAVALHDLALRINAQLGNFGQTLAFTEPLTVQPPDGARSFDALCDDLAAGRVETLVMLDVNPVYTAPAGRDVAALLDRVALRVHAGLHVDETAASSHWHVPVTHALESWSDARAVDGTIGIVQPLVRPFYEVRSAHVLLDVVAGTLGGSDRALVQQTWRAVWGDEFDSRWSDALLKGFVEGSAPPAVDAGPPHGVAAPLPSVPPLSDGSLALVVAPDPSVWDGRFANNPWLQELPRPLTKVTWGNTITIAPATATRLALKDGDEARLSVGARALTGAIAILPGTADDVAALTTGYGRKAPERIMDGLGYDAMQLADVGVHAVGATLVATGARQSVASTQMHFAMDGFDFVRKVADPQQKAGGTEGATPKQPGHSFYPPKPQSGPQWGMSIDLDACIGCNACVSACMAENNVPVVGKEQVSRGREMHWLRVDRYYEGPPDDPKMHFQPVPCMHCEQAPCEMGCPVNAAVHSPDGLNLQVYNRCIGTRTCSSYCPYKVRRFNWFNFTGNDAPELQAARNPEVTVRARGVMEKCTYCIQRISAARIDAKIEGRPIADGEVKTACQQACPTQAITFGDVSDAATAVSHAKAGPRDYSLLEEANTRPRTTYLAKIDAGPRGGTP